MSYPNLFSVPGMGKLAEKLDDLRHKWNVQDGHHPIMPAPKGDGTGSPTSIAQAGFHTEFVMKKIQEGKHSWRDLVRMQSNILYAAKKPDELKARLVTLMAFCAEWYDDIERRDG